jgi:hypothetical protein
MFDDEFLNNLPDDPLQAAFNMCRRFREAHSSIPSESEVDSYEIYIEAFAALEVFSEAFGLGVSVPELGSDRSNNIRAICGFFNDTHKMLEGKIAISGLANARRKYKTKFGVGLFYEFSDGDLARIQQLVNELREFIKDSEIFDANHKERILNKLEDLQRELHKKMSSLDKLWGLIGEAGIVLGKFGRDAKPFVDRIKEIAHIAWRTQTRAEELPSGTPLPLLSDENGTGKD